MTHASSPRLTPRVAIGTGRVNQRRMPQPLRAESTKVVVIDDEDLLQHPDRLKWYESKFCADDMPDWTIGRFVSSEDIAPGLRHMVFECEISRERVPLRNAYKAVGQRAALRVNSGVEFELPVSSAPFAMDLNRVPLYKVRGDITAEETKVVREPISIMGRFSCLVSREAAPDLWAVEADDVVEVGPFRGNGLDLKGSGVLALFRFPTVVLFVSGAGIANAKALLESTADIANLFPKMRKDIRVYYKVPNQASACYVREIEALRDGMRPCNFGITVTTSSFFDAFDDDQTLMYEPESTAAIILTGGVEAEELLALEACKEAEITTTLFDSCEQDAPIYWDASPENYMSYKKRDLSLEKEGEGVMV